MTRLVKLDTNHDEVVRAFEAFGYVVLDLARMGFAIDLFVARAGAGFFVETKTKTGRFTRSQKAFAIRLAKAGMVIRVARSADDVRAMLSGNTVSVGGVEIIGFTEQRYVPTGPAIRRAGESLAEFAYRTARPNYVRSL